MRRFLYAAPIVTGLLFAAPFYVAAATNSDILAILKDVIDGVLRAGRDAYCASGVAALCP